MVATVGKCAARDRWRAKLEPIDANWQTNTPGGAAVLARFRMLLGQVEAEHR